MSVEKPKAKQSFWPITKRETREKVYEQVPIGFGFINFSLVEKVAGVFLNQSLNAKPKKM